MLYSRLFQAFKSVCGKFPKVLGLPGVVEYKPVWTLRNSQGTKNISHPALVKKKKKGFFFFTQI